MPFSPSFAARTAVALSTAWLAASALAQAPAPAAPSAGPTVQDISVIAGTCANCHGPNGQSTGGIPTLRGVGERHLLMRMQAFKAGTAADATVMTRLMKGYDDAQIQALAQWFSQEAK